MTTSHFLLPPCPGNPHPIFCLYKFDCFIHLIQVESHSLCVFVTGLLYLARCLQDVSMLQLVSEVSSFLRLSNIPLYVDTTFLIHFLSMYIQNIHNIFIIVSSIAMKIGVLIHLQISDFSIFQVNNLKWNCSQVDCSVLNFLRDFVLFSKAAAPFCILTSSVQGIQFLHILTKICCLLFLLILDMLTNVR